MARIDDIRAQLVHSSEELADLALSLLGRAVDVSEEHERVELANQERRVTKARRAVEKAISVLGS